MSLGNYLPKEAREGIKNIRSNDQIKNITKPLEMQAFQQQAARAGKLLVKITAAVESLDATIKKGKEGVKKISDKAKEKQKPPSEKSIARKEKIKEKASAVANSKITQKAKSSKTLQAANKNRRLLIPPQIRIPIERAMAKLKSMFFQCRGLLRDMSDTVEIFPEVKNKFEPIKAHYNKELKKFAGIARIWFTISNDERYDPTILEKNYTI